MGLAAYGGVAAAAKPRPTIEQVQAQVDNLQAQVDEVGNQYDVLTQQLDSAKAKLDSVQKREGGAEQQFLAARKVLVRVAIGGLRVFGLRPGEWRELTREEERLLEARSGSGPSDIRYRNVQGP